MSKGKLIKVCGECANYDWKKHRCKLGCNEGEPQEPFYRDCPLPSVNVGEWISVSERLPKYNTSVLVYRPTMAMPIVADTYYGWYGEDDERWYEGWSLYGKNSKGENVITHWMELPEPPKGV